MELMIVLVVVSILVAAGYPVYQNQMTENRRTDGQRLLLEIMHGQQKFYSRNSRYTLDLVAADPAGLNYPDLNGDGTVSSEQGFYIVTAGLCDVAIPIADCVLLTAAPQPGQASDGPLTYNSRNVKNTCISLVKYFN